MLEKIPVGFVSQFKPGIQWSFLKQKLTLQLYQPGSGNYKGSEEVGFFPYKLLW